MKIKFYDWLWWNIGIKLWRRSARLHSQEEVKRRLNWMKLDCKENFCKHGFEKIGITSLKCLKCNYIKYERF